MSAPANYRPGSHSVQPAGYNFVSTVNLIQRDVDPDLVRRYGSQSLVMLEDLGMMKACDTGLTYEHYEQDRLMPKLCVQTAGASAGAAATFTLTSTTPAQQFAMAQASPYVATSPASYVAGIPVRYGDLIMLKPSSGVISASTVFQARVVSVNPAAGTFVAIPNLSANAIPALATDTEIIIVGKAFGEGSNQASAMTNLPVQYTNSMQIFKEAFEITGSLKQMQLYPTKTSYMLKGEEDCATRFMNYMELGLLLGEGYNNTNIANLEQLTPVSMTTGLIPTILGNGIVQGYSISTGFGIPELESLTTEIDLQKGSMENLLKVGLPLSMQIDRSMGDNFKNGGISYGFFQGDQSKAVDFGFKSFTMGEHTYHKSIVKAFTDLQTLGANGYSYKNEGFLIPADAQTDRKSSDKISSVRIRYQSDRYKVAIHKDLRYVSADGRDVQQVTYETTCGLEVMGANRFAYIKLI